MAGQRVGYARGWERGRATGLEDGHLAGVADARMGVDVDPDAVAHAYQRGYARGLHVPRSEYVR
jgi:hypothetical protein